MKQTRIGKYTKRPTGIARAKQMIVWPIDWFKRQSRKKKALIIFGPILAFLVIVPLVTYIYYYNDIKDQERLMNRNNTGVVLLDKDGNSFYSVGRAEHRTLVPLDQISPDMKNALIASEDKDFYKHGGFSVTGYARAFLTGNGGGSTLTQQLAKNTLLSSQHSYLRKYQELVVSIAIEQQYSKDQILDMYLNSVFYGENTFGIEEAAKTYFNTTPDKLTLAQSALLVGLLPAPSLYSPISGDPTLARKRQTIVLGLMVDQGYITEAQKTAALNEQLTYNDQAQLSSDAPHFAQMVLKQLYDTYGQEEVMRSGYQVKTTLDMNLQKTLIKNMQAHRSYIESNGGTNASAVAIDPKNGNVLALVGSMDFNNKQWGMVNMATTPRQPASTFKALYYSAALANGTITPATVLHDVPINLGGWKPQNADRKFRGDVTVRSAISQSLNIPSIEVMQKYGVNNSVAAAKQFGITTLDDNKDYGLTLAIGSAEVPLTEMTNAYAALANQGTQYDRTMVAEIKDKFGNDIFTAQPKSHQAISQAGAYLISSILSDNAARAPIFGSSLTVSGHTAAVKTGTTDNDRDAWTIGYTPSLVIGLWVGNNDNTVMKNGGSDMAGPIWRQTMSDILKGQADQKFVMPGTVIQRATCTSNHGLAIGNITAGTYQEVYLSTALPTETCTPVEPKISVCELATGTVTEIKEADFDAAKYSKDTANCAPPVTQPPNDPLIQVCDLATGTILQIKTSAFDDKLYSKDTTNCQATNTVITPVSP